MKHKVRIAKATEQDIVATENFMEAFESLFDYVEVKKTDLYKKVCLEMNIDPGCVSGMEFDSIRLEIARRIFKHCAGRWIRVTNTAAVMVDQICSNDVSYIELNPFLKRSVEGEIMGE